nr:MAG TPA: hypothetical protein [Caudoviricetes sp.]
MSTIYPTIGLLENPISDVKFPENSPIYIHKRR